MPELGYSGFLLAPRYCNLSAPRLTLRTDTPSSLPGSNTDSIIFRRYYLIFTMEIILTLYGVMKIQCVISPKTGPYMSKTYYYLYFQTQENKNPGLDWDCKFSSRLFAQ